MQSDSSKGNTRIVRDCNVDGVDDSINVAQEMFVLIWNTCRLRCLLKCLGRVCKQSNKQRENQVHFVMFD
jgi:hypothetical protein